MVTNASQSLLSMACDILIKNLVSTLHKTKTKIKIIEKYFCLFVFISIQYTSTVFRVRSDLSPRFTLDRINVKNIKMSGRDRDKNNESSDGLIKRMEKTIPVKHSRH